MHTTTRRIGLVGAIVALLFCIVLGRLFLIQVVEGKRYALECKRQSQRRCVVNATRGTIRDRNGVVLATSIRKHLALTSVSLDTAAAKALTAARSNDRSASIRRIYPFGEVAGAVLGYVGNDGSGLGGIEYIFDRDLRGEDGWKILQKDGRNMRYSRPDMPGKKSVDGCDINLTIDLRIQRIAENALKQTVRRLQARGGMCIIMEPGTGDILAMANEPGFNPNVAEVYPLQQRANQCISYNFEPGSTFKVITSAAALQERIMDERDTIDGNHGIYKVYDQTIKDTKPFGRLSFREAFQYSSNVCFAKIATAVGSERMYKYTKDFGLGCRSGVTLPGDESGIVHPIETWSGRTLATMAIGQEVSVTLLQMVTVFGAVANDGVLVAPRIFRAVVDPLGIARKDGQPKLMRRVVSADVAARLRDLLARVVTQGTGVKAAIQGTSVAGKTGTSQKIDSTTGSYFADRYWSSFIGFVPADKPVLVCGVVIDEPANGEMGGTAAAPVFQKIISQIISQPQLDYAERILHAQVDSVVAPTPGAARLPDVCGLSRPAAESLLANAGVPFAWIGSGEAVLYQVPGAGANLAAWAKLSLYSSGGSGPASGTEALAAPACVGMDLRDALNSVNGTGLVPLVKGMGIVRRQFPPAGTIVGGGEICTLFCSLDG
jgi:cell division protein FtsI/penicillin-binding protein 2